MSAKFYYIHYIVPKKINITTNVKKIFFGSETNTSHFIQSAQTHNLSVSLQCIEMGTSPRVATLGKHTHSS
jgi:hypothetical protein